MTIITAVCLALLVAEVCSQYPVPFLLEPRLRPPVGLISIRQPAYVPTQGLGVAASAAPKAFRGNANEEFANPDPYSFEYDVRDEFGNHQYRKEEGDGNGAVRGNYGYTDKGGIYRVVDYVADSNGFKANIRSNEPGVGDADPADVTVTVEEPPRGYQAAASSPSLSSSPEYSRLSSLGYRALNQNRPLASASARFPVYESSSSDSEDVPVARPSSFSPSRSERN